jgi:hypothetical protein
MSWRREESVLRQKKNLRLAAFILTFCGGCSHAPSVDILGSFFPAWMLCVTLGIVAAGVTRWLLLRYELEKHLSLLVLFYPSVALAFACLLWLTLFR